MKGSWKQSLAIARKELGAYFGSPVALILVGAFLVVTLFSFFWAETFFARNIADVRPLFRWMPVLGTIEVSPESSRLVVVGSAEFVDDVVLEISRRFSQDRYLLNLQLLQNIVDWAVEDEDLLSIRSRGTYARLLRPMEKDEQSFWEGLNYALALLAVIGIGVVWNVRQRSEEPMPLVDVDTARLPKSPHNLTSEG